MDVNSHVIMNDIYEHFSILFVSQDKCNKKSKKKKISKQI